MTWEAREFRILLALGRLEGHRSPGTDVDAHEIAQDAGLDIDQTIAGILALQDGAFLDAKSLNAGDGRIMAIHGIKLLPAGRRAIGQWPSPDSIEAKRAKRLMFMRHLYELTGGSRLEARPAHSLGSDLGWSPEDTDLVTDYLANEGLIEFMGCGDGGQVSITHPGVLEVEDALGGSGKATDHFSTAAIMVVQGDVHNSQFQLGTKDSQQLQESITKADSEALRVFIERIEASLSQMNLTHEQELDAAANIATVRAQLRSPRPKRQILREAVRSLRNLVEGVAGNAAFQGLLELARQLHL